ncbi:THUMP domain-containing protein 1 [Quillaja saponaria]|uniref:THUMP domain-containing protein 1 n=1 Tax=Quillaja saponaria TaxID=32244 RepID=A0AAD7PM08_QUISA|nr:THUMP domain-containing protein 1 [Quillaja saponaria]
MAADNKPIPKPISADKSKKRKQRYRPHNKPVKKKGSYPLRPGVQGFFITCDGGREHQASREAMNIVDSFYEELVYGEDSGLYHKELSTKPLNTKIKFSYSDTSSSDDDDKEEDENDDEEEEGEEEKQEHKAYTCKDDNTNHANATGEISDPHNIDHMQSLNQTEEKPNENEGKVENHKNEEKQAGEPPLKKQCLKIDATKCDLNEEVEHKSVDKLIEAELKELGDKNKRRFVKLDSGCNGVVFVQMRKKDGDPSPKDIVQHLVTSLASTKKHMSRFILRVLPIEVACYASEDEISKATGALVEKYFPIETQSPQKFAVLYEARANTGIDRMKIINAVAKSVPQPHKVDLNNPDKTIVVEIVKTVCLIGVVERYKEFTKYNLRQLTSPKP